VIDPTKLVRLARCATLMIDGVYLGTDKIDHFVHVGYSYFAEYRRAVKRGETEEQAVRRAVAFGSYVDPILSENGVLGLLSTGVRSNADLAANYTGFKFYRNLTESVRLRGEFRPPLIVRDGPHWRLNRHVRPNSDFFAVFISDHWDEALNPNTYGPGIGPCVEEGLRDRCDSLRAWYRDREGHPMTRQDFVRIALDLSTYYGEPYGYGGQLDEMVCIANSCFDDSGGRATGTDRANGPGDETEDAPDRLGRSDLWWAACDGQYDRVVDLLAREVSVHRGDIDGETPLHAAARRGHARVVHALIVAGADVNARSLYGLTPLHLAARELRDETVRVLLDHEADVNAGDDFGCTPLHDVAARGDIRVASMLLSAGADPDRGDLQGFTPRRRAGQAEDELMLVLFTNAAERP
jgi:hypothetical protein